MEAKGKVGKHDFAYLAEQDIYRGPAGRLLAYWLTTVDGERTNRRYTTKACGSCQLKARCTTAKNPVISRWEHEYVLEAAQKRLDENPEAMRQRRETVEQSLWYAEDAYGRDALPHEASAKGRHRDGAARARLQSDARDEHHGCGGIRRGDEGMTQECGRARKITPTDRSCGLRQIGGLGSGAGTAKHATLAPIRPAQGGGLKASAPLNSFKASLTASASATNVAARYRFQVSGTKPLRKSSLMFP
jgi:hypothetical protein